ncbi:MAG: polysaccharide deacetylase family protein [Oscillospiraceae bacterium]|nr:polysaccharide deacetylase family protein [Oscillospiraceae bacterium]
MKRICSLFIACLLLLSACSPAAAEDTASDASLPTETRETEATEVSLEGKKLIALTFDDGPNNSMMPAMLDVLEENNAVATFFLIGRKVDDSTRAVILRAYHMGCELGNHSYSHERMAGYTADNAYMEYYRIQTLIKAITGEAPKYFRAPFFSVSQTMFETIDLPFIKGYSFADYDSATTKEDKVSGMLSKAEDGAIFVLHVSNGKEILTTVSAVEEIIPFFRENGFEFVTLSQLFEAKGVTPEAGTGTQYTVVTSAQ